MLVGTDVKDRNIMLRYFICTFLFLTLAACQPPPEPETPKGVLRIATIPTDMPIIIDGQPKGSSPLGEGQYFSISLDEGDHKIEILKSIDNEKDQYADKSVFLAADTIQIVTLEAKERLTVSGELAKAKRDAVKEREKKLQTAKKQKALKQRQQIIEKESNFLNSMEISSIEQNAEIYNKHVYTYKSKDCVIQISNNWLAKRPWATTNSTITYSGIDLRIMLFPSSDGDNLISCPRNRDCINYRREGTPEKENGTDIVWTAPIHSKLGKSDPAVKNEIRSSFKRLISACAKKV